MKNTIRVITLFGCIIMAYLTADTAYAFTFNMGGGSWIDTSGTNNVLKLDVEQMNPDLDDWSFELDVGQTSDRIYFATIGTTEGWINRDDRRWGKLTAHFDFDTPDLFLAMDGWSKGFSHACSFVQGWKLKWDDPMRFVTASGLDISINLTNEKYKSWFWQGPDGTVDIYATVTLNNTPVPLPPSMIMLGTGMISIVFMFRRQHKNT